MLIFLWRAVDDDAGDTGELHCEGDSACDFVGATTALGELEAIGDSAAEFVGVSSQVQTTTLGGYSGPYPAMPKLQIRRFHRAARFETDGSSFAFFGGRTHASGEANAVGKGTLRFVGAVCALAVFDSSGTSGSHLAGGASSSGAFDSRTASTVTFAGRAHATGVLEADGLGDASFGASVHARGSLASDGDSDVRFGAIPRSSAAFSAAGFSAADLQATLRSRGLVRADGHGVAAFGASASSRGAFGADGEAATLLRGSRCTSALFSCVGNSSCAIASTTRSVSRFAFEGESMADIGGMMEADEETARRMFEQRFGVKAPAANQNVTPPEPREDSHVPFHVVHQVRSRRQAMKAARAQGGRRGQRIGGRIPKQQQPTAIEASYASELVAIVNVGREALAPLFAELPSLLAAAHHHRRDAADVNIEERLDVGDARRARELVERARRAMQFATTPVFLERLAERFARAATTFQREQLARQMRAALGVDIVMSDPRLPALIDHFTGEGAALIRSLGERSMHDVERVVARAFSVGLRAEDAQREIAERYQIHEKHARLIARDQIGTLTANVNAARQRELGITSFVWRSMRDERVRPAHKHLDGRVFAYSNPPAEGLPGTPIMCRCYGEPVFEPLLAAARS